MRRASKLAALFSLFGVLVGHPSVAAADDVREYAARCFAAVQIKNIDIPRSMNCFDGDVLKVTQFGMNAARDVCEPNGLPGSCDLPRQCDNPAWLTDQCYGNSYLTTFKAPSNQDVTIALLCRHKTKNTNEPTRFDDIAMILHNEKNGETCWFQTPDGPGQAIDGTDVPRPTRWRSAALFWLPPTDTMEIGCIDCHDSGPFIVSPWLNQAPSAAKLRDTKKTPYRNSTPPFDRWPTPVFISIGRHGLAEGEDKSCTHCHHIGVTPKVRLLGSGTCDRWINHDLTRRQANEEQLPSLDKLFMPPRSLGVPLVGKYAEDAWNVRYAAHVRRLLECCDKFAQRPDFAGDSACKRE